MSALNLNQNEDWIESSPVPSGYHTSLLSNQLPHMHLATTHPCNRQISACFSRCRQHDAESYKCQTVNGGLHLGLNNQFLAKFLVTVLFFLKCPGTSSTLFSPAFLRRSYCIPLLLL